MKGYTDIELSKKLAEILPIESADMFWADGERPAVWNNKDISLDEMDIPCWSLSALLEILPHRIDDRYALVSGKLSANEGWYICYEDDEQYFKHYIANDNLIDACYKMIIKLHEKKTDLIWKTLKPNTMRLLKEQRKNYKRVVRKIVMQQGESLEFSPNFRRVRTRMRELGKH